MAKNNNNIPELGTAPEPTVANAYFPATVGPQIASASPVLTQLRLMWVKVDALWGGTEAMRAMGPLLLPKEPKESDRKYLARLARTTLFNGYKSAIKKASARVFSRDVTIEDADTNIAAFCIDADNQGRNITQVAKDWAEDALNHGVSFMLVDYDRLPSDFATLEQQQKVGGRPYCVHIPTQNVLDARSAKFNNGERLSHFRYEEQVVEVSDDFSTNVIRQIRVFQQLPATDTTTTSPVMYAVYRQDTSSAKSTTWVLVDSGELKGVDSIPVVACYSNRIGFYTGTPLFMDLAELNIQHWQVSSDHSNIMHVVTVPFLFGKMLGVQMDRDGNKKELEISVHDAVIVDNADADLKWVEHNGKSIDSSAAFLKELESKMETLGSQTTIPSSGDVTATAHALSAAEGNSVLKTFALALQDSLNAVLAYASMFYNIPQTARCVVNTDYAVDYANDTTMQNVLDMFDKGIVDDETVIAEAKRRNVLDPMADIEPPDETPADEAGEVEKPVVDTDGDGDTADDEDADGN